MGDAKKRYSVEPRAAVSSGDGDLGAILKKDKKYMYWI
jgi:hypothetical protein